MDKHLDWHRAVPPLAPRRRAARRALARLLASAVRAVDALAMRLDAPDEPVLPARAEPVLEFYAEAGAPEGALYVDGRLVGVLPGVTRL